MLPLAALFLALQSSAAVPSPQAADAAFRAGYAALANGDLPSAEADFATAVRLAPRVAAAHSAYGAVLLQRGNLAAAVEQLHRARALDPAEPTALLNLGLAEAGLVHAKDPGSMRHINEAKAALEQWQTRTGKALPADASVALAAAQVANNDRIAALETLRSGLLGVDSADREARSALQDAQGALLVQGGRYEEASSLFREAAENAPERPSPHLHLGALLLKQHQPAAALPALAEAGRLAPDDDGIARQLAEAQFATGDYPAARMTLARVHSRSPNDTQASYQLALTLEAMDQPNDSIPLFEQVLQQRPGDASLLINLGLALVQTGRAKEAVVIYAKAAALDPNNPVLREDLGVAYLQQSDLEGAVREFRAGSALDPHSAQLAYDLGLALKLRDDLPGAITAFEHAAALDPTLPDAPYTLGVIYMQQGRFDAAAQTLKTAIALRPNDGDMWAMLGSVHKQNSEFADAADALRHAIALQPGQPGNHVNLAAVLAQGGDRAGAAAERKIAADLSRTAVNHQKAAFAMDSGKLLLSRSQLAEAEVQFRAAIAADPLSAAAHDALADLLLQQGKIADSAAERTRAAALASGQGVP